MRPPLPRVRHLLTPVHTRTCTHTFRRSAGLQRWRNSRGTRHAQPSCCLHLRPWRLHSPSPARPIHSSCHGPRLSSPVSGRAGTCSRSTVAHGRRHSRAWMSRSGCMTIRVRCVCTGVWCAVPVWLHSWHATGLRSWELYTTYGGEKACPCVFRFVAFNGLTSQAWGLAWEAGFCLRCAHC